MWACSLFLPWPFAKLFDPFPRVGQGRIAGYVGKPWQACFSCGHHNILMEFFNLFACLMFEQWRNKGEWCIYMCYKHSRLKGNQMPFTVNQLSQSEKQLLAFTRAAVGE